MAGKRGETLLTTMALMEKFTLSRAWTGLSDEEFFWEPVAGSWSVRRRADCVTATPFGHGGWLVDFDAPLAAAADWGTVFEPMTTVAWLLWHVGSMPGRTAELSFLGGTKATESGWTSPYLGDHPIFTSANEAVEAMQGGWRALEGAIRAASDDQLEEETRFWGYPGYPGRTAAGYEVVATMLYEVSHHSTQVCTLRDLYTATKGSSFG
jgi:hypothetical protein